ncbi:nucleotide exchange factor GrpE [Desulfococcus sp.]|uniref:nucleotide exchange factor GrpE n=1 Tax=Desulfococcus sp. TaxID=2025834 RepID=UPI00359330FE
MTEEKMEDRSIEADLSDDHAESPFEDGGMGESEAGAEQTTEQLKSELQEAVRAGREFEDRFMRLYAEFENYRKRAAREAQDTRKFANEAMVKEMLPVIDNLERAIQSSSCRENTQEDASVRILEGVTMTLKEILKVMERFHVKPIEALEKPFDPNFHEAVGREESDEYVDNIVIREYQKGYLLHDRLIRPAMVVVSRAKPSPPAVEEAVSDDHGVLQETGEE